MTIEARLRRDKQNKDGTRSLRIYVNHNKKHRFYTTGVRLQLTQWDEEKQVTQGLPRAISK